MTPTAWAFLFGAVAGVVAAHVAAAVFVLLAMGDEEREEVHKNSARIVE